MLKSLPVRRGLSATNFSTAQIFPNFSKINKINTTKKRNSIKKEIKKNFTVLKNRIARGH